MHPVKSAEAWQLVDKMLALPCENSFTCWPGASSHEHDPQHCFGLNLLRLLPVLPPPDLDQSWQLLVRGENRVWDASTDGAAWVRLVWACEGLCHGDVHQVCLQDKTRLYGCMRHFNRVKLLDFAWNEQLRDSVMGNYAKVYLQNKKDSKVVWDVSNGEAAWVQLEWAGEGLYDRKLHQSVSVEQGKIVRLHEKLW